MKSFDLLPKIFSAIHQAVIGTDGSSIIFANPSAVTAFGGEIIGTCASDLLPRELLDNPADSFLCAATLKGRQCAISVFREDGLMILFIDLIAGEGSSLFLSRHVIRNLRNNAMGIKMSADRCFFSLDEGTQPPEKHISMLYHFYYRILRTITQVDSADLLNRGELLFSPVPTDIIKLCADLTDTVSALSSASGVSISFSTPENEVVATIDPELMEQLLLNFLANSLKHVSPGNSITVSLRRSGERAVISVDDDGSGIPQETLQNIFAPPPTEPDLTKPETGTGLGLYIAYGIAQLHKGVLLIESREGEGTHVRLMLPMDQAAAPKFSSPDVGYKRSISPVLIGLAEVLSNDCFGPKLED